MNERFREFAVDAGLELLTMPESGWDKGLQTFAELIVKECADVCYQHSFAAGGTETAFGYGYKDCGDDINRIFGVAK